MRENTDGSDDPARLRYRLVTHLRERGVIRSDRVELAMQSVPRHRFLPGTPITDAYADQAIVTKRDPGGAALSSASQPTIVATMLEQLKVEPGQRILEIGAGTGYNAALLAHLAGASGNVTSIDIHPEVTAAARHALDATGFARVDLLTRDGAVGAETDLHYDRIVVTVGAWDIPPGWWHDLASDGRLVVPLRWRGQTRSLALTRDRARLRSESIELCGFIPMAGQVGEHTGAIAPEGRVSLCWDDDQPVDSTSLNEVLLEPRTEKWSSATVASDEPFDGVWLRLTSTEPATCRIAADTRAVNTNLCTPAIPARSPAIATQTSLAYLATRPTAQDSTGKRAWELGAIGHGPAGEELTRRICEHIRAWSQDRTREPIVTIYPADTPADDLAGRYVIPKRHSQLTISY